MINLGLGATSFLGVLGIILYLFLQRTRATPRNRLNTKPSSISDPVIIPPPDQRLTFTPPKTMESNRAVRNFSLISRRTADVPTGVQSLGASDPSQYSTTTSENLTLLAFPLPPAARQTELQEFVARLRREVSLRSTKFSLEERRAASEERLHKQIAGMQSEISYLTAQLDLAWAMGFGQAAPSADSGSRRSAESGTLSVHSRVPQASNVTS
ncbi:uncharacterized protein EV420DRAFT_1081827 [Desarmillaria tabescens]|nr:uncharacterized protein EV420DRAFT_1081827 [Desarmillaria tabescens]KAK0442309.1 hypothetical protein EV420DRAFT_1081827 [Desarmillaria tabescens]